MPNLLLVYPFSELMLKKVCSRSRFYVKSIMPNFSSNFFREIGPDGKWYAHTTNGTEKVSFGDFPFFNQDSGITGSTLVWMPHAETSMFAISPEMSSARNQNLKPICYAPELMECKILKKYS